VERERGKMDDAEVEVEVEVEVVEVGMIEFIGRAL
jgi:hypothetical protein